MSVVISYCCDQFAMIETDNTMTTSAGPQYADKLYPVGEIPLGYCAGAGLQSRIFDVRDKLNSIQPFDNDTFATALHEIVETITTEDLFFRWDVAFSFGYLNAKLMQFIPQTVIITHTNEHFIGQTHAGLGDKDTFYLFAPYEYINNIEQQKTLLDKVPSKYEWKGDLRDFLSKVLFMHTYIQKLYSSMVSDICDFGFLFNCNQKWQRRRIKIPVPNLQKILSNEKLDLLSALHEYEI